jgi:60 kDa SS-A/Ro ribonucleoprotein
MITKAYRSYIKHSTLQSEPLEGENQIKNSDGAYVYKLNDFKRLERFLILGSEGGSYYCGEKKLTHDNAKCVERCLNVDPIKTIDLIVDISQKGRAFKNDPAIFALAMAASYGIGKKGTEKVRNYALAALPQVCRIPTHLFHFAEFIKGQRGWGKTLKDAVGSWYNSQPIDKLAQQVVKYQQRDGWSNADLLRKSHPTAPNTQYNSLYKWIVDKELKEGLPEIIEAFEQAKTAKAKDLVKLIVKYDLTREMVPTESLNEPKVWDALLVKMPITATLRNLSKMTSIGVLSPLNENNNLVIKRFLSEDVLRKGRVHPLALLIALKTYSQGHGEKGSLNWKPVQQVVDALDEAFYLSFGTITPTNKNLLLALDVSGSMTWCNCAGAPITPREATGALSLVTANVESNYHIMAFSNTFEEVKFSKKCRLDDVLQKINHMNASSTNVALPMEYAIKNKLDIDAFIVYTDNETNAYGHRQPIEALRAYRKEFNKPTAKLIVNGMTSIGFSVADPNDSNCLDVVGLDTSAPEVMSQFIRE